MSRFAVVQKNDGAAINNLADRVNTGERSLPISTASAGSTLTAAQLIGGVHHLSGGSTAAVTTPTAAAIVAALKNAEVGSQFDLVIQNQNSGTATLTAGSGVTLVGLATLATTIGGLWRFVVLNATAGAEAVSAYRLTA